MTNTQGLADELAARAASLDRHEWFRPQYLLGLASTFREWDFADMWGRPEEAELAARYMETAFIDLTALRSEAAGQEWRPIESAPKDGTEFQAWVVRFDNETEPKGQRERRARFNEHGAFELWGRVDYDHDDWDSYPWLTPTHFMPLPTTPGIEGKEP